MVNLLSINGHTNCAVVLVLNLTCLFTRVNHLCVCVCVCRVFIAFVQRRCHGGCCLAYCPISVLFWYEYCISQCGEGSEKVIGYKSHLQRTRVCTRTLIKLVGSVVSK